MKVLAKFLNKQGDGSLFDKTLSALDKKEGSEVDCNHILS